MDFATLDTKTPAEAGAFLHLRHPALGHLLYDGEKPVGLMVRGTESKTAQDRLKAVQRDRMKGDKEGDGLAFVCSLVIGFQGVERDGKAVDATDANVRWFFGLSDGFVEQVVTFASDRASFFKPASRD